MPKIAVAMNKVILPGISTTRSGIEGKSSARAPKMVKIAKERVRPTEPH
jgi:hypothetical protein